MSESESSSASARFVAKPDFVMSFENFDSVNSEYFCSEPVAFDSVAECSDYRFESGYFVTGSVFYLDLPVVEVAATVLFSHNSFVLH